MRLQCPKCKKEYNVPDERITDQGVKITCPACKHQFIVKRRHEQEQEKKKAETSSSKKPASTKPSKKTPPCVVCGEPSTHVFQGPPPRPLCEHHYQIEKEKDSRFFEPEPGASDSEFEQEKPSAPQAAVSQEEPKPEDSVPPQVAEPVFESFDEEFDFMDGSDSTETTPVPGALEQDTSAGHEPSRKAEDPLQPAAGGDSQEGKGPGAAASAPGRASPASEEGSPGKDFLSAEAGTGQSAFPHGGGGQEDFHETSSSLPEDGGDKSEFSFGDGGFLSGEMPEESGPQERVGEQEEEDSFDFHESAAETSGDPFSAAALDDEKKQPAKAPAPKPVSPTPSIRRPKPAEQKVEIKGAGRSLLVIFLIILASVATGYVSFSGLNTSLQKTVNAPAIQVPDWQGSLTGESEAGMASIAVSAGKNTGISIPGKAGREAMQYLQKDTRQGYENALAAINKAQEEDRTPELLSLQIHALAFAESLGENGQVSLSSGDAGAALQEIESGLLDSGPLVRARAHVLMGEKDLSGARELLNRYLDSNPGDPLALSLLGASYLYQERPDRGKAIKYLEKSVGVDQSPVRAYWDLARAYSRAGEYQKAEKIYRLVLEKSPDRVGVNSALSDVQKQREDRQSEQVLDINPPEKKRTKPIKKTGSWIPRNVLEVISEVEPQIRKFNPRKARQRRSPQPPKPGYAPPPEAAPTP
ncbi:MAG: zinc-ribbon domain-containing protein [bacterium]